MLQEQKLENYRNTSINKLTEGKFTYKKLALTAVWDVSTVNGEPLASFTTKINGRAWIHDSGYASTFARTLDRALAQLFSQTDFQALLYDGYEGPLPEPNNRSAEESVLESIMDRSNSLFLSVQQQVAAYAGFSKQAKLTEVFAITQQVKNQNDGALYDSRYVAGVFGAAWYILLQLRGRLRHTRRHLHRH